ncbi:unnamed protein product [Brassica oleracea]
MIVTHNLVCNKQPKKVGVFVVPAGFNHGVGYFGVDVVTDSSLTFFLLAMISRRNTECKVLLSSIYFITEYVVRGLWSSLFNDKNMEYIYSFQNLNSLFISCRSLYAQNLAKKKSENHQAAQERPQGEEAEPLKVNS